MAPCEVSPRPDQQLLVPDEAERWIDEVLCGREASAACCSDDVPSQTHQEAFLGYGADGLGCGLSEHTLSLPPTSSAADLLGWSGPALDTLDFQDLDLAAIHSLSLPPQSACTPPPLLSAEPAAPAGQPLPASPELSYTGESLLPAPTAPGPAARPTAAPSPAPGVQPTPPPQHKPSPARPAPDAEPTGSSGCGADSSAGSAGGREPAPDKQRATRQARNRESAAQSRVRKKQYFDELEGRCRQLEAANSALHGMVAQLSAENASLKCQLAASYTHGGPPPYGYAGFAPAHPPPGAAVKVPIPAARPPAKRRAAAPKQGSKAAKRANAAAAPAVLLSLVACVLLVAAPRWGGSPGDMAPPTERGAGRVLTAVGMGPAMPRGAVRAGGALPPAEAARDATAEHPPPADPARAPNATAALPQLPAQSWAEAEEAGGRLAEGEVLQQLRRLGPLALAPASSLPAWMTATPAGSWAGPEPAGGGAGKEGPPPHQLGRFPMLAGNVFASAGLVSPVMCAEVLRFHAGGPPGGRDSAAGGEAAGRKAGPAAPARRSLAIPLPPADTQPRSGTSAQPPEAEPGPRQRIGGEAGDGAAAPDGGAALVSVLLPQRAQNRSGVPAQLDAVYVVVLEPEASYVTYKCALPEALEMRAWQASSL